MDIRQRNLVLAAALLALPALAGCGMMRGSAIWPAANQAAGAQANSTNAAPIHLAYRIDAGQLGLPLAVSCVEAQQVSYEEVTSSPLIGRSIGVLDIRYPHPAGKPDLALVGVVIQRQQEPNRGMTPGWLRYVRGWFRRQPADELGISTTRDLHEAWVLEIPKTEVDALLARLKASGFYDEADRDSQAVNLLLTAGDVHLQKNWSHVPELDALMHRARSQGQLVSYQGVFESGKLNKSGKPSQSGKRKAESGT